MAESTPSPGARTIAAGRRGPARTGQCRYCGRAGLSQPEREGHRRRGRRRRRTGARGAPRGRRSRGSLVDGLVDACEAAGIPAFGPSAAAAQLEGSKSHCKAFLLEHGIPTGAAETFTDAEAAVRISTHSMPCPSSRRAGCRRQGRDRCRVEAGSRRRHPRHPRGWPVRAAGAEVLLEERLFGTEVSVLAFCDGTDFSVMPAAKTTNACSTGRGPQHGGMGAFHPSPIADDALLADVGRDVIAPTLAALAARVARTRVCCMRG